MAEKLARASPSDQKLLFCIIYHYYSLNIRPECCFNLEGTNGIRVFHFLTLTIGGGYG